MEFGGYHNTGPGGVAFLWAHQATLSVGLNVFGVSARLPISLRCRPVVGLTV